MATQAQFEANRRSPTQSAIPNPHSAIKPGLLAKVIPQEIEGFQDLLTSLYKSLRPQDELQRFLVDQIALCMIRLQRSAAWEAQSLARPAYVPLPPGRQYEREEPPQVPASVRVPAFIASEGGQALLRYENACNRQIKRNLELLLKLQSANRLADKPACPYLQETDDLEGAAPSAPPLPSCPEDTWPQVRVLGPATGPRDRDQPGTSVPGDRPYDLPFPAHRSGQTPSPCKGEGPGMRVDTMGYTP